LRFGSVIDKCKTFLFRFLNALLKHCTVIIADVIALYKNMINVMDDFNSFCIENNDILFGAFFVQSDILLCLST